MKTLNIVSLIVIISIINFVDLLSIPAFARKYNISCQTCHSPMPRLKAFGDEFAINGFAFPDKPATRYFVETGDDQLSLIRDFPLAVRLDMHLTYKTDSDFNKTDLQSPYLLKILSGGEFTKDVAYYFYFYISERGKLVGLEDAYLMFNNLFNKDFDFYLGQFQISDPLFKRELRLTLEDYEIYKTKVGNSLANLAYDRGIMLTYGLESGTDIIFEIVNGNGIHEANVLKEFDKDPYKNYFGRISQDIGENIRIGAFGYLAKEEIEDNFTNIIDDKITMWGPDLTLNYNDILELNLQYAWRKDTKANHIIMHDNIKTQGAFAELIYTPMGDESKWYLVGLFNWVESDLNYLNYKSSAFHIGYLFRRNMRMVGEYKYDFINKSNLFSVGIVSAF